MRQCWSLLFACVLLATVASGEWYNPAKDLSRLRAHKHTPPSACKGPAYVFHKYLPSTWEQEWLDKSAEYSKDICGHQRQQKDRSRSWVQTAVAYRAGVAYEFPAHDFDPAIWSHFEYTPACQSGATPLRVPVEPAVGHLRHPFFGFINIDCAPEGEPAVGVDDRSYLLPSPVPPRTFFQMYPGRALLLDMGTGPSYNSSLRWFVDTYAARGITFDRIWTWEVNPVADQEAFWGDIPSRLRSRIHFHNVALTAKAGDPFNPVNIITSTYQPGDYIVLKLDIEGNTEVEGALIQSLLEDSQFRAMIGEVYYELHFEKDVFNLDTITLTDALQTFRQLRSLGVRVHYWP